MAGDNPQDAGMAGMAQQHAHEQRAKAVWASPAGSRRGLQQEGNLPTSLHYYYPLAALEPSPFPAP